MDDMFKYCSDYGRDGDIQYPDSVEAPIWKYAVSKFYVDHIEKILRKLNNRLKKLSINKKESNE